MFVKIASITSLRNLTGQTRTLLKQGNATFLKCYSRYTSRLMELPSPQKCTSLYHQSIKFQNVLAPTMLQTSKLIGNNNNLITTRNQSSHGSHVNIWKLERIVSAAFVPLLPLCLLTENSVLDGLLAVLSVIHVHWGLEAIIVDYARPIVVGPVVPKVLMASLYAISALTLAGLLVLIYNGPGISKSIKQGWAIGKDK